jgi:chaperonin GroES
MEKEKVKFDITEKNFLYDNILVKIVETEAVDDVLVDPRQYSDKPEIGRVVAVGAGRLQRDGAIVPLVVKVGDVVMFNRYSSTKYRNPLTREDFYVVREEDIVCY